MGMAIFKAIVKTLVTMFLLVVAITSWSVFNKDKKNNKAFIMVMLAFIVSDLWLLYC